MMGLDVQVNRVSLILVVLLILLVTEKIFIGLAIVAGFLSFFPDLLGKSE